MSVQSFYKTLINHEGQYSVWPTKKEIAWGWIDTGFEGTYEQCLDYINQVWTDMEWLYLKSDSSYIHSVHPDPTIDKVGLGNHLPLEPSTCIHHLFEQHVKLNPHAIAITYGSHQMTYDQVNTAAEKLANRLSELQVGPDKIVMVMVERSCELIISLLAILKTGGCYLSLEHTTPQARLDFIIEDAVPHLIITQTTFNDHFVHHKVPVLLLDKDDHQPISFVQREKVKVTPEHLAYISYTSGSTGVPKGVCIPHRAVTRLVDNNKDFTFITSDVFLLLSPIAFDASTFEVWSPLTNGGRLVIYDEGMIRPDALSEIIEAQEITTVWLTAGLFHVMVNFYLDTFKGIKHVFAGGDVISPSHLELLLSTYPHLTFTNGYGPTENTTFSTCWTTSSITDHNTVPIGKPINGTWAVICNEQLEAVSVGETGELYVAGAGLARNYLNNPVETAARFVPNPWSEHPGGRMLKTGDLVRLLEDGNIEFVGRIDRQVKINGYRVEPDEIEIKINRHASVQSAVVITQKDNAEHKRLIAYIVLKENQNEAQQLADLHHSLCEQLPAYMIPWAMIPLTEMPLTANGKVDRHELPAAKRSPRKLNIPYTAPRNAIETKLARLWGENLSIEPIGIHDNFFSIGGDSLILSELIVNMEQLLDAPISARFLYLKPTIAEIATIIEEKKQTAQG